LSAQASSGERVQVRIAGGSSGKLYLITFKITTNAPQSNTVEAEGYLLVENT
jgi:hypothetical protein